MGTAVLIKAISMAIARSWPLHPANDHLLGKEATLAPR